MLSFLMFVFCAFFCVSFEFFLNFLFDFCSSPFSGKCITSEIYQAKTDLVAIQIVFLQLSAFSGW